MLDTLVSISGEADPLRNILCGINLGLPRQTFYLHQLQVPCAWLLELVKVLLLARLEDLGNHIQRFSRESSTVARIADSILASFTCQSQ